MGFRLLKSDLNFLLIAALLLLLITVAVLQYRWIGQTSDSEHTRMRERTRLAAESMSRDFDRELTRAFLQLLVDPVSFSRKDWDDYALRYERWSATAPYPKLITDVFIAERNQNDGGGLHLSVYNKTRNRFEETTWLPQLARVQSEIETDLDGLGAGNGVKKTNPTEMVAPDVPALVIPISRINLVDLKDAKNAQKPSEPLYIDSNRRAGYTIVLLNFDYIKNELLPLLAARYFDVGGNNDGDNYKVVVAKRNEPSQIIYNSGSSVVNAETLAESDIQHDLFALRFDEIESLLPVAPRSQTKSSKDDGGKPKGGVAPVVVASQSGNEKGGWQLFAQYKNGSLEAAIESMRRRSLFLSFGVLLLLAANGVFLIILLNRERKLARQKSDFVASITHELRTPLAVIRATSENIADQIITDAKQIQEYGLIINAEERRLTSMIEQLLESAGSQKIQNSDYPKHPERAAEIIEAALNDYQTELNESDFQVTLNIEPDLPEIVADREALRRAVGNLINNVVKYGRGADGEKGRIKISARTASDKTRKQIEITVEDNGAGIERKDIPHIFKLFYRGRTAAEPQIKGSGIGLSLVKQIVEAHGGTVSVLSRPNQGSTFTMRLPTVSDDADCIR